MTGEVDEHSQPEQLLDFARAGDEPALGELLEHFRPQLHALARESLRGGVVARVSESDIVQQTCLLAVRDFAAFQGEGIAQFAGWLQAILRRNVLMAVREHKGAEKRDVTREVPGSAALRETPDRRTSPSQKAIAFETDARVKTLLAELPEAQRDAIQGRYIDGLPLAEIATRLGRTEQAVAGLLKRGLARLRELLAES